MYNKKSILIVDDDYGLRQALKNVFEDEYDLAFAESGEEALQIAGFRQPLAILMDYRMPGLTGIQTMSLLRDQLPASEMIIMSAFDDLHVITAALGGGAFDFIAKPFELHELKLVVDQAVKHSEKILKFQKQRERAKMYFRKPIITQREVDEMIGETLRVACL